MYTRLTMLGINLDVTPADLPPDVWSELGNMIPKPGGMHRARGYAQKFGTPLFAPEWLLYTPQLGEMTWLYAGTSKVAVIDQAGLHTDVTPSGIQSVENNGWTGGNLNGIACINAVENPPYYWFKGMAAALPLPGQRPNTRYRVLRPFKYHLVGLGVLDAAGDYRDSVHWSDAADPGQVPATWIPGAENEAGDNLLSDENGDIIDGLALRDSFYIYKQDSVYEMTYIGGQSVFRFRKVFASAGVLASNCIVTVKGTHIVLGKGDIYQHDGQNQKSIINGVLRDAFFATIDDLNFASSFAVYLEAAEEVWFCVPTVGNTRPTLALVYGVITGVWGYRALPVCDYAASGIIGETGEVYEEWDTDANGWDTDTTKWADQTLSNTEDALLIASAANTKLYKGNEGTTLDGTAYRSTVGRLGLHLDDPAREKAIRRIFPRLRAPADAQFTLEVFNQRDPMAPQEQVQVRQFYPGNEGVAVNCNARYMGFRIFTDASVDWSISGVDVEYMPQGYF